MKRVTTIVASIALLFVAASQADAQKATEVVTGVVTTAAPFSYVDKGVYTGVSNDILAEISKTENIKLEYMPMKFDALIPAVQAGQIDMAVSGIFVTEARSKILDFSSPYFTQGSILVAPIGSPLKSSDDLQGKIVAVQQGAAALAKAKVYEEKWDCKIRVLQDPSSMQMAMKAGDIDAMLFDSAIMMHQIQVEGDKPTIKTISDVIDPTDIAFAFPKGSPVKAKIDSGIAKMKANGELDVILQKYHLK